MAAVTTSARCKYCGTNIIAATVGPTFLGGPHVLKKSAVIKLCRVCDDVTSAGVAREPMTQDTTSRRCTYCERGWPATSDYEDCPLCREPTVPSGAAPTLTDEQAASESRYAAFGWWLWDSGQM